ncbi:MAG: sensor histidine kinase [Proteobacteria bacterium]|nr:sensor histidine kinase [Pseudomonadota bacterium]
MSEAEIHRRVNFKFNLRTKLMLIFLVLVLIPLVVIGWFSIKITEDLIAGMVHRQLYNVAVDKISLLEHWLNERKADLTVISKTSILKSMDTGLIEPYLELMRHQYGVYKDFSVFSASGDLVFTTNMVNPVEIIGDNRTLSISDISYMNDEKESSFTISVPIFTGDNTLLGNVSGRVGTNRIVFIILNVSLGKTGECYLVDDSGRFLAHKDPSRILSQNITQTGSFKSLLEDRSLKKGGLKKAYRDYRGIMVLGTSLNLKGTPWYIVVEQDQDEAFESSNRLKLIVYLTICLGIASAMMLIWIISRHIVKPIRTLSRYAAAIAESRFDEFRFDSTFLKKGRTDEIDSLSRSFYHMFQKLKERQNDLEQKVESKEAELKETGSMLKKTQDIAEQSEKFAALGRMGASVAHEIRTPLTSLKLYLESVKSQIDRTLDDIEDYRIAMGQIQRMEGTINRFLDYAKPRDLVFSMMDVHGLLDDVLLMVKPLANRNECALSVVMVDELPMFEGDRKRLSEALINLVVNAIESIENHGEVILSTFLVQESSGPSIRIDITDTGPGISEDRIDNIFEPFFTTKASGTGLGLSLVLQTVKSHGGTLTVKSVVQKGTTFSLNIPINVSDSADKQQ